MDWQVTLEELNKTSFIKCIHFDGRRIPLQSCFNDEGEWEMWLPGPNGLIRMKGGEPVEGHYFAKNAVKEDDGFLAFSNFMLKRAYFNDVVSFVQAIMDDFHNLGASIDKLKLFHSLWIKDNSIISNRYVSTELEYIFKVCRSMYDLLQEIICRIWKRFRYIDENKKTKALKSSFAKMVLSGDKLFSVKEIEEKYLIPTPLAKFYHSQGNFFYWLREYRNRIDHGGKGFDLVFITGKGFAVSINKEPFSSLNMWNENNTMPNSLGSVRSAVAYVVLNTLKALEDFTIVISSIIKMPYDIAPEHLVFVRGKHTETLIKSNEYIHEQPWNK